MARAPAPQPCGSCPYRRDVPSGLWETEEYDKLPQYDGETHEQPPSVFLCHRQDGRVCAGWAGCHDMGETLAVRFIGLKDPDLAQMLIDYETAVPLFGSGEEAAAHGLRDVDDPSPVAERAIGKLLRRQRRLGS